MFGSLHLGQFMVWTVRVWDVCACNEGTRQSGYGIVGLKNVSGDEDSLSGKLAVYNKKMTIWKPRLRQKQ